MAWKRGDGDTDYELARVQSWIEFTDPQLFGPDGDDGVIREHRDDAAARKASDKLLAEQLTAHNSKMNLRLTILSVAIAALMALIGYLTWIDSHAAMQKGLLKLPHIAARPDPVDARLQESKIPTN
jgi:hypothetical protein